MTYPNIRRVGADEWLQAIVAKFLGKPAVIAKAAHVANACHRTTGNSNAGRLNALVQQQPNTLEWLTNMERHGYVLTLSYGSDRPLTVFALTLPK